MALSIVRLLGDRFIGQDEAKVPLPSFGSRLSPTSVAIASGDYALISFLASSNRGSSNTHTLFLVAQVKTLVD